jgi:chromosome segregation ATPase
VNEEFVDLRRRHLSSESFWPAFTDIMMVVVIIFLLTSMILMIKNWELLNQLRTSMAAEEQAEKIIHDTSLEKATLEEQLAMAQSEISALRMQLLQASEQANQLNLELDDKDQQIIAIIMDNTKLKNAVAKNENQISSLSSQLITTEENLRQLNINSENQIDSLKSQLIVTQKNLKQVNINSENQISSLRSQLIITQDNLKQVNINSENQISSLNSQLIISEENLKQLNKNSENQISSLRSQIIISEENLKQLNIDIEQKRQTLAKERQKVIIISQQHDSQTRRLSSLEDDFGSLQVKYDKLFKPARTAKGKYLVSVSIERINGKKHIRFKDAGDKNYTLINKKQLHSKLAKLQKKYTKNLYIKIVIPERSGLTYNEAWEFMKGTLHKYDYYYQ